MQWVICKKINEPILWIHDLAKSPSFLTQWHYEHRKTSALCRMPPLPKWEFKHFSDLCGIRPTLPSLLSGAATATPRERSQVLWSVHFQSRLPLWNSAKPGNSTHAKGRYGISKLVAKERRKFTSYCEAVNSARNYLHCEDIAWSTKLQHYRWTFHNENRHCIPSLIKKFY